MKKLFTVFSMALSTYAAAQGVVVLEYHEVVSKNTNISVGDTVVTTDQFNSQMRWLKSNGYYTVAAGDLAAYMKNGTPLPFSFGKKPIVITFDDGWANQQNALAGLNKNGFIATFNIVASFPGTNTSYLTWNQLRSISSKYKIEMASHTMTHPTVMDPTMFFDEITQSKSIIEKQIGKPVKTIAWPNGYFTDDMTGYAISSNYIGAQTIDENWCTKAGTDLSLTPDCRWLTGNTSGQDSFLMKRLFVDGRCTVNEFGTWVTQGHSSWCAGMSMTTLMRSVVSPTLTIDSTGNIKRVDSRRDDIDRDNDGDDHDRGDNRHHKGR
jgi:peptidoglycan/xylan/chitin deacetylase (PgdA/CDA1 family)